ncbi:hypothetical protein A1O1_03230 [Capronia coronata CBS 617.96]|uniref:FAD-binding domain-containing protein n=1 Tax=Capronia coronata CBS 617.96 TaxID=1182541 RepID=W9YPL6_9EURO|nr:uncharacterized protein A1O1_03230 [Capronia coronata CBS 617.96]EXJ94832.1 hypothetical protein A1O1_03230 [Capronia coronata CBS 617.96]
MSSPHILIIGSGLGGLTLAQALKKNGVPFTVFERDASATARAQGYRFRLHEGSEALQWCLPADMFGLFERTCGNTELGITMIDPITATVTKEMDGADPSQKNRPGGTNGPVGKAYTVDRTMFRSLLLLGLESDVQFSKRFTHYTTSDAGVTAHFSDSTTASGTFLVGAEGVHSPVRKQFLPDHKHVDTGGRFVYGKTLLTPELRARFPAAGMSRMTLITDNTPMTLFQEPVVFAHDASVESHGLLHPVKDYMYWVLLSRPETFGLPDSQLVGLTGQPAADLTLKVTQHWDPAIRSMLELQSVEQTCAMRIASVKPDLPAWTPSAQVAVLGDAVHAMSPTGAQGANVAIKDAASLAKVIVAGVTAEGVGPVRGGDEGGGEAGDRRELFRRQAHV